MVIKLERNSAPSFLTEETITKLTNAYMNEGKCVWNNEEIKNQLMAASFGKCAYCECSLKEESKYMEVEHFEDKKKSPHKVIVWKNLLPSCKRCNGSKLTHDVRVEPIVNPYEDDPRDHLYLKLYRFKGKTKKGASTIDVINLNDTDRLVYKRFEVGNKLHELIDEAIERYSSYKQSPTQRRRNRLVNLVRGMLAECQPTAIYSATTATILITDESFRKLVEQMNDDELWDSELNSLYEKANEIKLNCEF